ncbi:MAG: ATP-binding protein [Candidatus Pacebacteria bacterium]|nr:ATP-binding protein [Candidatus Paceibacterota bacterium]MCF7857350.1 ATP-binding protein [Candidatus Paceibacterota bacterium]
MIRKLKFKNFYSFKEEQVLDFTVTKKKSDEYYESLDGTQISKVMAFVGPNASGKTSVMKLFGFLSYFLTSASRDIKDTNDTGFNQYAFSKPETSLLSIEFETAENLFTYELELDPKQVYQETLHKKILKKRARPLLVFHRTIEGVELNKKVLKNIPKKQLALLRSDISLIAFLKANFDVPIINEVYEYFNLWFANNINESGYIASPETKMDDAAQSYLKIPSLKEKMEEFIRNFDVGIDKFLIEKIDSKIVIKGCHKINDKEHNIPFQYESRGTKTLFVDLLPILGGLEIGNCLIIDEIETGLHPQAVDKLISYIVDHIRRSKKQFIFSSHSFNFLELFDAPQIYLVEKNENKSEVFRLDSLGVRPDENFYSKYMSGAYGAFPKIRV